MSTLEDTNLSATTPSSATTHKSNDLITPRGRGTRFSSVKITERGTVYPSSTSTGIPAENPTTQNIGFLQSMVNRLSSELSKLQSEFGVGSSSNISLQGLDTDLPLPPWLTNSETMSPLLHAYDTRISELEDQVKTAQDAYNSYKLEVKSVLEENNRLHSQLTATLRAAKDEKLASGGNKSNSSESGGIGSGSGINKDSIEWAEMEERVNILNNEIEILHEAQRQSLHKITELKQNLEDKTIALIDLNKNFTQVQEVLSQTEHRAHTLDEDKVNLTQKLGKVIAEANELELENEKLEHEIRETRIDLRSHAEQLIEHRNALEELTSARDNLLKDKDGFATKEREYFSTLRRLENELDDTRQELVRVGEELAIVSKERDQFLGMMAGVEGRISESESRELAAFNTVKDSVQMVEDMRLERDQAVVSETAAQEEVRRLGSKLAKLSQELDHSHNEELDRVKSAYEESVSKLNEKLRLETLRSGELQTGLQRALRDKRTAENELEQLNKQGPVDQQRLTRLVDELTSKLLTSERDRDSCKQAAETAELTLKRSNNEWSKERAQLLSTAKESQRRQRHVETQFEEAKSDRLKLLAQLDDVQRQLRSTLANKESILRKKDQENAHKLQLAHLQVKELENKLTLSSQTNHRSNEELEELISAQQVMTVKWREEAKKSAKRFDRIINDLKTENHRLAVQNETLTQKVDTLITERQSIIASEEDSKRRCNRLESLIEGSETRMKDLQSTLAGFIAAESAWLSEKKELQRQVDSKSLDLQKLSRTNRRLRIGLTDISNIEGPNANASSLTTPPKPLNVTSTSSLLSPGLQSASSNRSPSSSK